ncbi:unnamed protein product [Mesocestoides corti]|uniref:Innexin n=1 Tax=Mesocestoides corti TaxID=53468 RepID=A0A0R3UAK9_MESCO|nr:unnamed protein product [Mesocestoides corti]
MVAQEFLQQLDKLHFVDSSSLHDFADRCAYLLSFIVLVICFTIVTLKSYVLEPLSCYTATTFSGSNMISFINAFCWVNGTVPADVNTDRLEDPDYWDYLESKKVNYYQWVSLVLALQAIMCYFPNLVWETITFNRVGTNLGYFVEAAQNAAKETGTNRTNRVQFLASSLDTLFFARRPLPHGPRNSGLLRFVGFVKELLPHKRLGRAICAYYFATKLLYFANAVLQLVFMEYFLGMSGKYRLFGLQVLHDIWHGHYWQETLVFPRVGFCRVPIKLVGRSVPTLIAQCSMPVNMLNEKIYVFLWFWFVGVATLQVISISIWILRLSIRQRRVRSLVRYMKVADVYDEGMKQTLKRFESACLRPDGSFILHMLRLNAGEIITNEILQALVDRFIRHEKLEGTCAVKTGGTVVVPSANSSIDPEKMEDETSLKKRFI